MPRSPPLPRPPGSPSPSPSPGQQPDTDPDGPHRSLASPPGGSAPSRGRPVPLRPARQHRHRCLEAHDEPGRTHRRHRDIGSSTTPPPHATTILPAGGGDRPPVRLPKAVDILGKPLPDRTPRRRPPRRRRCRSRLGVARPPVVPPSTCRCPSSRRSRALPLRTRRGEPGGGVGGRTASTVSPPNIRIISTASTQATTCSATTPVAGTAHTSERSRKATVAPWSRRRRLPAAASGSTAASSRRAVGWFARSTCRPRSLPTVPCAG